MAIKKTLKKGGVARYVIQGAAQNDFFTLPRGFRIRYLGVENTEAVEKAASVSLGKVPGAFTVATFTVTGPFTSSSNAATWGGGAYGTVTSTAAVVTLATAATSAAYIASTSPVMTVAGLTGVWYLTANGAAVTMTSSCPGSITAPTLTVGSSGLTIGSITTVAGSVDATYMPATAIPTTVNAASNLTSAIPAAYIANSSVVGSTLSATFTSAAGAAGTYTLAGQTISIPNALSAIATGFYMGGCGFYEYTIATSGTGTYFINGVSITGSATPATLATNIAAAIIPGWTIIASSAKLSCYSHASGYVPQPTLTLGTATTLTLSGVTWLPGYTIPGYLGANATPITNTVTLNGVAGAANKVAINGIPIQIPNGATAAQSSPICAGASFYKFQVSSSSAGTNGFVVNGVTYVFTSSATPATTATNVAALVVQGWTLTAATDVVTMVGTAGNTAQVKPYFVPGAVAVPVLAAETFNAGTSLPGYTCTFNATTAVWVGPAPMFTIQTAPTTQTILPVMSFGGATGSMTITQNQVLNPGAPAPTLSGALTTQTYTQSITPADLPYYLNFYEDTKGKVNVYALLEKVN